MLRNVTRVILEKFSEQNFRLGLGLGDWWKKMLASNLSLVVTALSGRAFFICA
jgi:hypothetical protein